MEIGHSDVFRAVTTTGQFCAKQVPSKNIEAVSRIIVDAAKAGAQLIFLPEASDFIANRADETPSLTKPLDQSEFVQGVRERARETGVWVSVGVHETVCALPQITPQMSYPFSGYWYFSPLERAQTQNADSTLIF